MDVLYVFNKSHFVKSLYYMIIRDEKTIPLGGFGSNLEPVFGLALGSNSGSNIIFVSPQCWLQLLANWQRNFGC